MEASHDCGPHKHKQNQSNHNHETGSVTTTYRDKAGTAASRFVLHWLIFALLVKFVLGNDVQNKNVTDNGGYR